MGIRPLVSEISAYGDPESLAALVLRANGGRPKVVAEVAMPGTWRGPKLC